MGLRDPRQHQSGIDCMVQLVELSCGRSHQTAAVDGDHHLLAALSLDLDHHRPVAARGRGPADAPHVVSPDVVAQSSKSGGRARRLRAPLPDQRAQAPAQRQLDALDGDDVREHSDVVRQLQAHLAAQPAVLAGNL